MTINHKPFLRQMSDDLIFRLVQQRVFYKSRSESRAHVMLYWLLCSEDGRRNFEDMANVPMIIDTRYEYPVGRDFIDILLIHADASLTVIEVKGGDCDRREILKTGIGQAIHYSVQLGMAADRARIPTVRRCLAVLEDSNFETFTACEGAGVIYYPLADASFYDEWEDRLVAKMKVVPERNDGAPHS